MKPKVLIIGFGSAGERHAYILKKKFKIKNLSVITNRKISLITLKKTQDIKNFNPDIIVVSNSTFKHLKTIKYIEKNFKNKIILVEKPLFEKNRKLILKKNKVLVGYNMRFNPIIKKIKKIILNRKIWSIHVFCGSYLPNWRMNISYSKSSSSIKPK